MNHGDPRPNVPFLAPDAVGHVFAHSTRSPYNPLRQSASQRKLGCPVVGESSPVRLITLLASIAGALWLPSLIESFEIENIHSPGERCADASLEEFLLVHSASMGVAVVRSTYTE